MALGKMLYCNGWVLCISFLHIQFQFFANVFGQYRYCCIFIFFTQMHQHAFMCFFLLFFICHMVCPIIIGAGCAPARGHFINIIINQHNAFLS